MNYDFSQKLFCVFGLNACGKTEIGKHIARAYKAAVFDVLGEYVKEFPAYVPRNKDYPAIAYEFEKFIAQISTDKNYDLLLIDEANRIFPNHRPLMPAFRSFLDTYRHYNKSVGFICRRPAQLQTDIVELSHYILVFNLKGKNDTAYFNCLNSDIRDKIARLPPYHFAVIDQQREVAFFKPINIAT